MKRPIADGRATLATVPARFRRAARVTASTLALASTFVATACVVGVPEAPSRLAVARATTEPAAPGVLAADPSACAAPEPEPRPPAPNPSAIFVAGSCHFDGVRSVWIGGYWEDRGALAGRK